MLVGIQVQVSYHQRGEEHSQFFRREVVVRQAGLAPIEQIATTWPTSGYRRVTAQLRRKAEPVEGTNSKRVRRLLHELGLVGKAPVRRRCRTTDCQHPGRRAAPGADARGRSRLRGPRARPAPGPASAVA